MPHLRIETNIPKDKIPTDLKKTLCQVVASTVGKPVEYVCVTIVPGCEQSWGGTDDPCAQAALMCIGELGVKENVKHSKAIFEAVEKGLGIAGNRMYIHFQETKSYEVGHNSTTIHEIFGE